MSISEHRSGPTGLVVFRRLLGLLALLVLAALEPSPATGAELRLDLSNDFLTDNLLDDDLYTFGIELAYTVGRYDLALAENAFTDSHNGLRFDETYLSVGRDLAAVRGWHPHLRVGLLRVGRGLFGQSFQNRLHGLIGDREVDLPYVQGSRLYPTLALGLWRQHSSWSELALLPKIELQTAPGFKSSAVLSVEAIWQGLPRLWVGVEVGARFTDTGFAPLRPWIAETGAVAEVSVGLPNDLVVSWNYNRFGTRFQHVSLQYRWRPGTGRPANGPRLLRRH